MSANAVIIGQLPAQRRSPPGERQPPAADVYRGRPMRPTGAGSILHGDCVEVMRRMPSSSVDFILTDPPYICRYHPRDGRRVANDDNARWLCPAFTEIYRLLKPATFCVSFYGWNKAELFLAAWRAAGFRPVGHIVFRKRYASGSGFLNYQHESAYLLAKGDAKRPGAPVADVLDWRYTVTGITPPRSRWSASSRLLRRSARP